MAARSILLSFTLLVANAAAFADTINITLGEIDAALGSGDASGLVTDRVNEALDEAGLSLDNGQLLFEDRLENVVLDSGCSSTTLQEMQYTVRLNADTALGLEVTSLTEPILLNLDISARLDANGRIRQIIGADLFGCVRVGEDNFNFVGRGDVRMTVSLRTDLNFETLPDNAIRIAPVFSLQGQIVSRVFDINVDNTLLDGVAEDLIRDKLDAQFNDQRLQEFLRELEVDLRDRLIAAWGADNRVFRLPQLEQEQLLAIADLLQELADFPVALEFVEQRQTELLLNLIIGNDQALQDIALDAATCQASQVLQASLEHAPLHAAVDGVCTTADLQGPDLGMYYSDAQCTREVAYRPTRFADYCAETLDKERLGNAAFLGDAESAWTLWPGNRFDIGVLSIETNQHPFMTRARYRTVDGEDGLCELEMRIYKQDIEAADLKPALAFHGGSWKRRGFDFSALESQISHLTAQGFVVFVPFYRLTGDGGNTECNGVTGEAIVQDVQDALGWVRANGARYGAADEAITVGGQSAGAHLATWLAVNRSMDVERALLLYPPADLPDFINEVALGNYGNPSGISAVEGLIGGRIGEADPANSFILANEFPALIAADPLAFPPLFIIHGNADDVVPSRQAVRLCNAKSGSPDAGPAVNDGGDPAAGVYRRTYACDADSELHLIAEGQHGLDFCVSGVACRAGSDASQAAVRDSLVRALVWLQAR